MQLSLLVPELIWPEPDDRDTLDGLACPALETLFARSRLGRQPPQSLEATLSDAFGHAQAAPYAAFRLLGESGIDVEAGDQCWVAADPVHLRFHQEHLILADSGSFGIALDEAQALAGSLSMHLADVGRFHVATAERWYLQLADTLLADGFDSPPLSAVAGRSIEGLLAETSQARSLRKLLNEIQMLMHAHPINQLRENAGRLPINSLWLWGAGSLPPRTDSDAPCRFDGVWSSDPLALGLARAAGVPTHRVPVEAATLLEHAAADTSHLVVLDDLLGPVHYENGEHYRGAVAALEKRWFAPLHAALSAGKIRQLRIEASTAYALLAWECRRSDLWKVWRRPQPLAGIARGLA
jgi:hypothetical protein